MPSSKKAYQASCSSPVAVTDEYVQCVGNKMRGIGYHLSTSQLVSGCANAFATALDDFGITCRRDGVEGFMASLMYESRAMSTFIQPCDRGSGGFHITETNWNSFGRSWTRDFNSWFGLNLDASQMQKAFWSKSMGIRSAAYWWVRECGRATPVTASTARNCIFPGDFSREYTKVYTAVASCTSLLQAAGRRAAPEVPVYEKEEVPVEPEKEEKPSWIDRGRAATDAVRDRIRERRDNKRTEEETHVNRSGSFNIKVCINEADNFWVDIPATSSQTIGDVQATIKAKRGIDPKWCALYTPDGTRLGKSTTVADAGLSAGSRVIVRW